MSVENLPIYTRNGGGGIKEYGVESIKVTISIVECILGEK